MSECVIFNKYIYLYIYLYICLSSFVANEEKFFLRYNGGEKEWEFELDLNTEGGKELYERLKKETKIELTFKYDSVSLYYEFNDAFSCLLKNYYSGPRFIQLYKGAIAFNSQKLFIFHFSHSDIIKHKIGYLIETEGFSSEELEPLANSDSEIKIELVLKTDEIEKFDNTKIAELNKKIIIIIIIGLSILIILFIIKFIV